MRLPNRNQLALGLQWLALWPLLPWAFRRFRDGSDEPWGWVALLTLGGIAAWQARRSGHPLNASTPENARRLGLLPAAATLAFALSLPWLPPLPSALLGLLGVALSMSRYWYGRRIHWGIVGLAWLSIPLMASLDFYLGYPLRLCTAELAQGLLRLGGTGVVRQGVSLMQQGREVAVDPACSGLRMLWGSAYVVSVLGCIRPLPPKRWLLALAGSFCLLLLANGWRTAALFYSESGMVPMPRWGHEAVGTVIFVGLLLTIALLWRRLAQGQAAFPPNPKPGRIRPPSRMESWPVLLTALGALVASAVPTSRSQAITSQAFPGWPETIEGERLTPEEPPAQVSRFYRDFPGKVGYFRTQRRRVVLRWVTEPTRKLHPAEQCYRGSGYRVISTGQCLRPSGNRFGCFSAELDQKKVRVSERIYDSAGGNWTDSSSWYWAALLGKTRGPWFSVTLAELDGAV